MGIEAVVFDLDYTLAVPTRDRQTLLDEATTTVGAPSFSRESYLDAHRETHASRTREPIFTALLEATTDARGSDTQPDALAATYRKTVEEALTPVAGVESLLGELGERYRVGMLTDGPVRAQQGKIDALGWNERFDAVVITGELDAAKPDARAFNTALDALSVPANETVYVGDDPEIDVAGAATAGLHTVQVLAPNATDPTTTDLATMNPTTSPDADVTLRRDALADRLPEILAAFE